MKLHLADLPQWLDDLWRAGAQGDGNGGGPPRPETGEPIREKTRNTILFRLACAVRTWGCTEGEIYHLLHKVNAERCLPPLGDSEVRKVAGQVFKRYTPDPMAGVTIKEGSGRIADGPPGKPTPRELAA